jgi:hypothetical protein
MIMTSDTKRFEQAIAAIDAVNATDPRRETAPDGKEYPKELLYGMRMSDMLERFAPEADEAMKLAVRAQHIKRWAIPRSDYPMTNLGYKQWRTTLYKFHADLAADILREAGYDEESIKRVHSAVRKEALKLNKDTQLVEDVADLVFLEHYIEEFVQKYGHYDQAKMFDILRKTWKKMSDRGHEAALKIAKIPAHLAPTVVQAVTTA